MFVKSKLNQELNSIFFMHYFLTWKKYLYFSPSCGGGTISLHHSFNPSLPVRHLETQGELLYEKARAARRKI